MLGDTLLKGEFQFFYRSTIEVLCMRNSYVLEVPVQNFHEIHSPYSKITKNSLTTLT